MSRSFSSGERDMLAGEISVLQSLDVAQLRARWRTLYKTEAPPVSAGTCCCGRWPTAYRSGH